MNDYIIKMTYLEKMWYTIDIILFKFYSTEIRNLDLNYPLHSDKNCQLESFRFQAKSCFGKPNKISS